MLSSPRFDLHEYEMPSSARNSPLLGLIRNSPGTGTLSAGSFLSATSPCNAARIQRADAMDYILSAVELSALHRSAARDDDHKVEVLLASGEPVDGRDAERTPLMLSSMFGHSKIVKLLLRHKADVRKINPQFGSALLMAAYERHHDIVCMLLKAESDVNAVDGVGVSSLIVAAAHDVRTVEALLKYGASVCTASTDNGITALYVSAKCGQYAVVKKLIEAGAPVEFATTIDAETALHAASEYGNERIVGLLLENRANPYCTNSRGATPLDLATNAGHHTVLKTLLSHGVSPIGLLSEFGTPLTVAVIRGHYKIAKTLIKAGVNVNQGALGDRVTALMCAKSTEFVKLLIAAGASPHAVDIYAYNALHWSVVNGCSLSVITCLVHAGVDLTAITSNGFTPLDLARAYNRHDVAALLEKLKHVSVLKMAG